MNDINNKRKKIEEKYKNLSVELETILDIIPGMLFCKDKNDVITRVNQTFADFLKLNKEDIIGKTSFDLFPPEQAEKFRKDDLEVMTSKKPKLNIEESANFAEGKIFSITNKVPNLNEKGEIIGTIGLAIDITERKVMEQKLKESEEKNRSLIDALTRVGIGIDIVDLNFKILYQNKVLEDRFGRKEGISCYKTYLGLEEPCDFCPMIKAVKNNKVESAIIPTPDGRIYDVISAPLPNLNGIIDRAAEVVIDITERKQTEIKLKKEREKAELYLNLVNVILVALDRDGIITLINKKGCEILGYPEEELIGKSWFETCIPPQIKNGTYKYFKKLLEGEIDVLESYENLILTKQGNERLIAWSTVLLKDNSGNATGTLGSGEDITERKKIEENLKDSEVKYRRLSERYEMLLESITDGVYVINRDWVYTLVNKMAEKLIHMPIEKLLGNKITDVFPDIEHTSFFKTYETVMNTRKPERIGDAFILPDGQMGYYEVSVYPIREGILCIGRNVTEEKKAEQKLKESEQKYRFLFESSPYAIILVDLTGKIIDFNPSTEKLFGFSKHDLLGKISYDLLGFYPKEFIPILRNRQKDLLAGKKIEPIEIPFKKKDDNWGYAKSQISLIQLGDQKFFQAIIEDITEKKDAENKLKESEKMYRNAYEQAEFYKDLFAHDISNILQNIQASLGLLSMWQNTPEKTENTSEIMNILNEQVVRGSKLVSNIRKLSQISETEIKLEFIEIVQILKDAIKFIYKSYPERDLSIHIDSPIEKIFVQANELLLDLFENILINAVKYNINPNIEILIKLSKEIKNGTKFIKIEFIDNGVGVPDAMKERIFGGIAPRKDKVHGMGLGLLLVKRIIINFNGQIWVEDKIKSDTSQGSNFILLIPEVI